MKPSAILITIFLPSALLAQTRPTSEPSAFDEIASAKAEVAEFPAQKLASIKDAAQLKLVGGNLVVHSTVRETDGTTRLEVPDLPGVNTIRVQLLGLGKISWLTLINRTADKTTFIMTSINVSPGRVELTSGAESDTQLLSVDLMQSEQSAAEGEPRVILYVKLIRESDTLVDLHLTAESVEQLRREHPRDVEQYLAPIFRTFKQEAALFGVDSRAAWQIFSDAAKPSDQTKSQIEKLLIQLDAESFKDREAASKELETLGQPAAAVLMNHSLQGLSEEQKSRVATFLAPFRPLTAEQAKNLKNSPQFLIDCLVDDDEQLRSAALAQLSRVVNHSVEFNLKLEGDARLKAVSALRASLAPTSASQPAFRAAP